MRNRIINRMVGAVTGGVMIFTAIAGTALTAEASAARRGKSSPAYISDVFIAYGEDEEAAASWLRDKGWEPVPGDFNAGKASAFDNNVAAVMGIRRTALAENAVTDMAVMNMKGDYGLPDYDRLISDKKTEIDEYIRVFMPVIREYRANLSGEGSELGKKRADEAYRLLNLFYDGDPDDAYAVNDTGMHLGDLFLTETRQEGNANGGDLQQIILESSVPAMTAVKMMLAYAADPEENTWLDRLSELTLETLAEHIEEYFPDLAGQNLSASAVTAIINQKFGDAAQILAEQWSDIHEAMVWYETYCEDHGLWQADEESDKDYYARVGEYLDELSEDAELSEQYAECTLLYHGLYGVPYEGEWGRTLGDFFCPYEDVDYSKRQDLFLPMAAALSDGQRAALDLISLRQLLHIGFGSKEGMNALRTAVDDLLKNNTEISVYTGVNRGLFRGGVAITDRARMEENMGRGPAFDGLWDNTGAAAVLYLFAAIESISTLSMGSCLSADAEEHTKPVYEKCLEKTLTFTDAYLTAADDLGNVLVLLDLKDYIESGFMKLQEIFAAADQNVLEAQRLVEGAERLSGRALDRLSIAEQSTEMSVSGRCMMGLGGAILVGAAVLKVVQLYQYYQREFTPIPRMIVDESDSVTYLKDENGNNILDENGIPKKNISFNRYEYYDAVRCNRQQVGKISDWQDGVDEYDEKGCGDIADLNVDQGQEWLALYTVKSKNKGNPILADSLTIQYGSDTMPKGCTIGLHFFTYNYAMDLGDMAYSFANNKHGVYFFWDSDANAYAETSGTASAFSAGYMAIAAIAGLLVGILGTTMVLRPRKKRAAART